MPCEKSTAACPCRVGVWLGLAGRENGLAEPVVDVELFPFTFANLRRYYEVAIESGYRIITCLDWANGTRPEYGEKLLVNRVDIDVSPGKTRRLAQIYSDLGIRASFFVRLHANEYNPFSFENYRCLRALVDLGHEVGLHSEVIDQAAIWKQDAEGCLRRDLKVLASMLDIEVKGVASHGGSTGLNNLDFWKNRNAADFGLSYEAYDESPNFGLFNNSFYLSDSSWTFWKCYDKGVARPDDRRKPDEHFRQGHELIYFLIHPETYYDEHFYE